MEEAGEGAKLLYLDWLGGGGGGCVSFEAG